MKILTPVALALALAATGQAAQDHAAPATESASARVPQTKIDPNKEADIRHLLDVVGTTALMQQMMNSMEQSLKPMLANSLPPGEYRDRLVTLFFDRFHSKLDLNRMLDLAVSRYDEHYSDEEIKGLIKFYESPLGQKVVTVLPKLTAELQQDGRNLGRQVGRESMIEVLAEHRDLAQAIREASRTTSPPAP